MGKRDMGRRRSLFQYLFITSIWLDASIVTYFVIFEHDLIHSAKFYCSTASGITNLTPLWQGNPTLPAGFQYSSEMYANVCIRHMFKGISMVRWVRILSLTIE